MKIQNIKYKNKVITTEQSTILALDAARKTGWAIYKTGEIVEHGTKIFSYDPVDLEGYKIFSYKCWLDEMIEKHKITMLVAEDIFRDTSKLRDNAFEELAGMKAALLIVSFERNLPVIFINPITIKQKMIPSVLMSFSKQEKEKKKTREECKNRMISAVTNKLGYKLEKPDADDEADAIGILITYINTHNLPIVHPNETESKTKQTYT